MQDIRVKQVYNNFKNLKCFVLSSNDINVDTIKLRFRISRRRLDFITNAQNLISVLEKLGELDAFNIRPVEIISESLSDPLKTDLQNLIRIHKTLITNCDTIEVPVYNQYAQEILNTRSETRSTTNLNKTFENVERKQTVKQQKSSTHSNSTDRAECKHDFSVSAFEEATDCISIEIGRKWKDLARYLKLKEEEIEEIDYNRNLTTLSEKARKVLCTVLKREEPVATKQMICDALSKVGKNNIRKKVELIL